VALIGAYEVVRLIARDGMATVYEARQPALGRLVALKRSTSARTTRPWSTTVRLQLPKSPMPDEVLGGACHPLGSVQTFVLVIFACLAAAVAGATASADEPKAPASPDEIVTYRQSGEWTADTRDAVRRARRLLRRHLDDRRPAIVLDVDDTSLSTYACMKAADFDRKEARCGVERALPAIPQILGLYRLARRHDVAVFFVTGRREQARAHTIENLKVEGYTRWKGLRLRPDEQPLSRRDGWKARVRRAIERRGYRIVVNVGDQRSDLDGGHALRSFKLPNPMYVIPTA
jgi:predicted secreted acid phosphatase